MLQVQVPSDKHMTFTNNELNNIIYLCLKYVYGSRFSEFKDPKNSDIKQVMLSAYDDQSIENILDSVVEFVIEKVGPDIGSVTTQKNHMRFIINEVLKQPYDMRNDLGVDAESEDLITKH